MCGVPVYPVWAIPILIGLDIGAKAGRATKQGVRNVGTSTKNASSKIEAAMQNMKNNVYNAFHEDTLKKALERDPNNPQLHVELAMDYMKNGELDQALQTLEHAVKLSGTNGPSTPLFYLAVVQTITYHADEALVTCDLILKKAQNSQQQQPSHKMLLTDFHKPTFCKSCSKMLLGLRKQGYKCSICEDAFHVDCAKTSLVCPAAAKVSQAPSKNIDSSHQLSDKILMMPTWCNTCNRIVRVNQKPKYCSKCDNTYHADCVSKNDYCLASPVEMNIPLVLNLRGTCYYNLEKYDAAIKDFMDAISLSSNSNSNDNKENYLHESNVALLYANLGLCYFAKKEMETAVKEFTRAISLGLKDSKIFNMRAIAYQLLGRIEEAKKDRQQALELNPHEIVDVFPYELPRDLVMEVFGHLNVQELQYAALACKRWHDLIYNKFLKTNYESSPFRT